jgi:hypothetical protein
MKNATLLSRAEMRNVLGGVMDKETTLQWCIDHLLDGNQDLTDTEKEIILSVGTQICYDNYNRMDF